MASNAMDENGDSNPFGWSPLEGVAMETQGKHLTLVHGMLEHYTNQGN